MIGKRICPISMANPEGTIYCYEEKCQWWDDDSYMCGVISFIFEFLDVGVENERIHIKKIKNDEEG